MTGVVLGLHVNPEGGVPKHPVQTLSVHKEGCAGDKQNDRKHHGGPEKAVSILEAHVLEALQRQGHPIMPGSTGENVLLGGTQPGDLGAETEVCQLPADAEGRVALTAWVDLLRERAHNEILVEAGPTLAGAMLKEGWVDRLVVYQAPKLLGDAARPMAVMAVDALADAIELSITEVTRLDTDLRIIATPRV